MSALRLVSVDGNAVSNPPVEQRGGFVAVPNALFDALLAANLTGRQLKIALAVVRKTHGFGKQEDDLTIQQLADITGLHRPNASTAFNWLVQAKVLVARKGKYGFLTSVNAPESWQIDAYQNDTKTDTTVSKQYGRTYQNDTHNRQSQQTVVEEDKSSSPVSKSRKLRSVNSDTCHAQFESFWNAYPRKQKKKETAKAFAKLGITKPQLETILEDLQNRKQSADWLKDGGQFIPLPTSYLNAERWNDEPVVVVEAWTPEQQQFVDAFNDKLGAELGDVIEWTAGRAEIISRALASKTWDLQRYVKFFAWLAEGSDFDRMPRNANFDWLMRAETFAQCIEGRYSRGEA